MMLSNKSAFGVVGWMWLLAVLWSGMSGRPGQAVAAESAFSRENIEWCDVWLPHVNETNLPRVLLIGDSITRAYAPEVERRLAGKVYVSRLATSAFVSDPMLLEELKLVLDHNSFAVIQANNGMHGWQHSEAEYAAAFPQFWETIRLHAHGARLIWADTTPLKGVDTPTTGAVVVPDKAVDNGKLMLKADLTRASDERITQRNAIARDYVQQHQTPCVDLHTPMLGHPEWHSDNVHFNHEGIARQADLVAREIVSQLPAK